MRTSLTLAFAASLCSVSAAAGPNPELIRLKKDVAALSDLRLRGRAPLTSGSEAARRLIISELKRAGARPAGDDGGYEQAVRSRLPGHRVIGFNVVAVLQGRRAPQEYVYLEAHYDHWGESGGIVQPGANDNATGVAMLLGLARKLAAHPPDRSIVFLASDNEEGAILPMLGGMKGAYYQLDHPPFPPARIKAALSMDMLGGRFVDGLQGHLFLLGSESSTGTYSVAGALASEPGAEVPIRQFGIYAIEPLGRIIPRGDYDAFRGKKIPFVFATSGTAPEYHTARDTADTIDYDFLFKSEGELFKLARELASRGFEPAYSADDEQVLDWDRELRTEEYMISRILEHPAPAGDRSPADAKLRNTLARLAWASSLPRELQVRTIREGFTDAAEAVMKINGGVRFRDLLYRDYGP